MPKNILQISDSHILADKKGIWWGRNTFQSLKNIVEKFKYIKFDLILMSGDQSEDGSIESYYNILELMKNFDSPCYALPGNHDKLDIMKEVFKFEPLISLDNWKIFCLNSCVENKAHGYLSENSFSLMRKSLREFPKKNFIISLHHNPVEVGIPFTDPYMLHNYKELIDAVKEFANIKAVIFGHAHSSFETTIHGVRFICCPATSKQFLKGAEKVTMTEEPPACQILKLEDNGTIERTILSL